MADMFTYGRWTVVEGKDEDFIRAWNDLAQWTSDNIEGAGWAKLLRDGEDRNLFLSFGTFDNLEAIQAWRTSEGFTTGIGKMRGLLQDFEAHIAQTVLEIE